MPEETNGNLGGPSGADGPRIGLVLGAGGVLGAAWLIGALHALSQRTGWDPKTARYIVGTSAGSVIGSLVAAGLPTSFLVHHQRGGEVDGLIDQLGEPMQSADAASSRLFRWTRQIPWPFLGSPQLALRTALQPWRFPPAAATVGWLGRGFLATDEIGRIVRAVTGDRWPDHPNLWITAVDYATGRRVVFGSPGAPDTELHRAVEASCSIPAFYRPVRIDGRLYIDGGAWSPSNADLLTREDVDLVVALNPMSTLHPGLPTTVLERLERRVRAATGRRLGREVRKLREAGKEVLLIQPRDRDLDAMGINMMNPAHRVGVLETALDTTRERLDDEDCQHVLKILGAAGSSVGHD